MLKRSERFGENICGSFLCRDELNIDLVVLQGLMYEMVAYIDLLGALIIRRILSDCQGALIVREEDWDGDFD